MSVIYFLFFFKGRTFYFLFIVQCTKVVCISSCRFRFKFFFGIYAKHNKSTSHYNNKINLIDDKINCILINTQYCNYIIISCCYNKGLINNNTIRNCKYSLINNNLEHFLSLLSLRVREMTIHNISPRFYF